MKSCMKPTRVFNETIAAYLDAGVRVIVNRGGTRSGKTYSILQLLALICDASRKPLLCSVVTQTFPQLRTGAMRDFVKILDAEGVAYLENKSEHSFKIGCSLCEFFSADQYTKVLGAQRDILYVNECNRLGFEVVRQLMVRTAQKVFLDYNPVSDFWVNKEILTRNDCRLIDSTYKDNLENLLPAQIAEIEAHKKDENWWRVYGLGLEGRLEGLVYPRFDLVERMPEGCRVRYGIDFGMNDPTAIVKIGVLGDNLYLQEICYRRNMITADISQVLQNAGLQRRVDRIVCDCAAPEQIETLYREGWNAVPCKKGRGSVMGGIDLIKRHNIHIIQSSQNLTNEIYNYTWEKDKNDKSLDIPIDDFNHALDACRYAVTDLLQRAEGYSIGFAH